MDLARGVLVLALGLAEEEAQLGPQLVELARVTCNHQPRARVGLDSFGNRETARRAIELVPARVGPRRRKRGMKQGWHCESAAAYPSGRRAQVERGGEVESGISQ